MEHQEILDLELDSEQIQKRKCLGHLSNAATLTWCSWWLTLETSRECKSWHVRFRIEGAKRALYNGQPTRQKEEHDDDHQAGKYRPIKKDAHGEYFQNDDQECDFGAQ